MIDLPKTSSPSSPTRRRRHGRGAGRVGATLPLVAVLLPVLIVFLGFSVDLAYMQNTRLELRAATDAAARAGATELSKANNMNAALRKAKNIARRNTVAGKSLTLEDQDITFGRSEHTGSGWEFSPGATPPNAVRVSAGRTSAQADGAVRLFFGSMIGVTEFEPVSSATASFLNIDIILVLDRSSSMKMPADDPDGAMYTSDPRYCSAPWADSRWTALDVAVGEFLEVLEESAADEKVAIATYSSDIAALGSSFACGEPYEMTATSTLDRSLTTSLDDVESTMASLGSALWNGNTNIEAGMRTGLDELFASGTSRDYADKVMIVFTDGNENEGDSTAAAYSCADSDVVVHTVTFGVGADQDRMAEVAAIGHGTHQHAEDGASLREAFEQLAAKVAQITE